MSDGNSEAKPPYIEFGETKQQCFDRHFGRLLLKVGDPVVFKKPKRNKVYGRIEHIETDIEKMYWVEGGSVPRYIRVAVEYIDKETGEIKLNHIWTTESKILWSYKA